MANSSHRNKVYDYLCEALDAGRLVAGDRISEIPLSEQLGVSRTPVREAIRQLETEGLVVQYPRVGTFVKKPTRREVVELYEEREALEPYVAGLAAERMNEGEVSELDSICDQMETLSNSLDNNGAVFGSPEAKRLLDLDTRFHNGLANGARNKRLIQLLTGSRLVRNVFVNRQSAQGAISVAEITNAVGEHRQILKAVRERDVSSARAGMEHHIRDAKQRAVDLFDANADDGSDYYDQLSNYLG